MRKLLLVLLVLTGCESKLGECISLSLVVNETTKNNGIYCWTHTNHKRYCVMELEAKP